MEPVAIRGEGEADIMGGRVAISDYSLYNTPVERGSKYNPYQCPECGYKSTRRANMKIHLAKVHGLAPDLPGPSQRDWVEGQVRSLANKYAQAQLEGDKQGANRIYDNLTSLYYRHQDILTLGHISRALEGGRRRLGERNK